MVYYTYSERSHFSLFGDVCLIFLTLIFEGNIFLRFCFISLEFFVSQKIG